MKNTLTLFQMEVKKRHATLFPVCKFLAWYTWQKYCDPEADNFQCMSKRQGSSFSYPLKLTKNVETDNRGWLSGLSSQTNSE
jgi:hypothetical protein